MQAETRPQGLFLQAEKAGAWRTRPTHPGSLRPPACLCRPGSATATRSEMAASVSRPEPESSRESTSVWCPGSSPRAGDRPEGFQGPSSLGAGPPPPLEAEDRLSYVPEALGCGPAGCRACGLERVAFWLALQDGT